MILQQLIQKNKTLLRKALKKQIKNTRSNQNNNILNLLQKKKLSLHSFNLKSFLLEQNKKEIVDNSKIDAYFINGQKYRFMRDMSNKIIKQEISYVKLNRTHGPSNEKWVKAKIAEKQKRLIQTANDLTKSREKNIQNHLQNLPDSFTLKKSRIIQRAKSTSIKYDLNQRQNCIHSRQKYLDQEKNMRRKRIRSHSFSSSLKGLLAQPENLNQKNNLENIKFQVSKISLTQGRITPQNEASQAKINIFQEYRKAKMKYEKQDFYSPWKKLGQRKQIDLTQLYQLSTK